MATSHHHDPAPYPGVDVLSCLYERLNRLVPIAMMAVEVAIRAWEVGHVQRVDGGVPSSVSAGRVAAVGLVHDELACV
jgi:hypothetical protein